MGTTTTTSRLTVRGFSCCCAADRGADGAGCPPAVAWGSALGVLRASSRTLPDPEPALHAHVGTYRSFSPWTPLFRIVLRGDRLWLLFPDHHFGRGAGAAARPCSATARSGWATTPAVLNGPLRPAPRGQEPARAPVRDGRTTAWPTARRPDPARLGGRVDPRDHRPRPARRGVRGDDGGRWRRWVRQGALGATATSSCSDVNRCRGWTAPRCAARSGVTRPLPVVMPSARGGHDRRRRRCRQLRADDHATQAVRDGRPHRSPAAALRRPAAAPPPAESDVLLKSQPAH